MFVGLAFKKSIQRKFVIFENFKEKETNICLFKYVSENTNICLLVNAHRNEYLSFVSFKYINNSCFWEKKLEESTYVLLKMVKNPNICLFEKFSKI